MRVRFRVRVRCRLSANNYFVPLVNVQFFRSRRAKNVRVRVR